MDVIIIIGSWFIHWWNILILIILKDKENIEYFISKCEKTVHAW